MLGSRRRYPEFTVPFRMPRKEAWELFYLLVENLGVYQHVSGGCTNDDCSCFANGYERGREDERAEHPEPLRNEGRD